MDIAGFLEYLESSSLAVGIRDSLYMFPVIEAFHVLGLTLVFGTISIVDLRLLGIASTRRPFTRIAADIVKWTWAAFALSAVTGLLMFITNADVYFNNFAFRTKIVLLALSGVNLLIFELTAGRTVDRWDKDAAAPPAGKTVAVLSLVLWIGVIFAGRWIGFTTSETDVRLDPDIDIEELFPSRPGESGLEDLFPSQPDESEIPE